MAPVEEIYNNRLLTNP